MAKGDSAWFSVTGPDGTTVELALLYAVKAKADGGDGKCRNFICAAYRDLAETQGRRPKYVDYGSLRFAEGRSATAEEAAAWTPPAPPAKEWDLFSDC